jgi:sugar-specific transcriptional regulator TrmB
MIPQDILEKIGLTKIEATLYWEVLRHVAIKPAVLARRLNVSRPTVYDALRSLETKGLIYETHQKKTRSYAAKDPRNLEKLITDSEELAKFEAQKKRTLLTNTLPELLAFTKGAALLPKVQLFEGEHGIWNALQETLTTKDIIRAYANIDSIVRSMGEQFDRYLKQRVDLGIRARAIAPDTEKWRQRVLRSAEELRDVRFIESSAEYSPEINIFDDRVLMISWKENFAVLIASKDFAHAQRVIYDELWTKLSA